MVVPLVFACASATGIPFQLAAHKMLIRVVECSEDGEQMLKITKSTENTRLMRVTLHGYFTGDYVREVEKALSENGDEDGKVALDLMYVTFVDRAAMEFLSRAKSSKIKVENVPSYVTRWIEQEIS